LCYCLFTGSRDNDVDWSCKFGFTACKQLHAVFDALDAFALAQLFDRDGL
jgi:hypothetical protein